MAAAHTSSSSVRAVQDAAAGKAVRRDRRLEPAIEQQLIHEDDLETELPRVYGYPIDRRMPHFSDSASATKNFITRVQKPFRSVLHLALGLQIAVDFLERRIVHLCSGPAEWERHGFRTLRYESPAGETLRRPVVGTEHILLCLRWSLSVGQCDGLDKLGPGSRQAATLVISSAPYASSGVWPARALWGRPAL